MSSLYQNRKLKCDKKLEPSPTVSAALPEHQLELTKISEGGQGGVTHTRTEIQVKWDQKGQM